MRYSTTTIVLAAMSIGEAVAGPIQAHVHRKFHEKKDVDWDALNWSDMGINWSSAYEAGLVSSKTAAPVVSATAAAAAVVAASVTIAAVAPATTTGSSLIDEVTTAVESDLESLFDSLAGVSNSLTSFGSSCNCFKGTAGDNYIGEVGSPYGSNIVKVDSTTGYDFTNTFKNTQSKDITINVWNKAGHDLRPLSGSAFAPTVTTLTFVLAAGKSQVVAFMENSQVGWAQSCSSKAESGAFATSWGEANFLAAGSGYDLSVIMNSNGNDYNMSITSEEAPACTSDMTQNFWLTATDPVGGSDGSCFIAQSTAHLTTVMAGTV